MFKVEDLKPGMLVRLYGGNYGILIPVYNGKLGVITRNFTTGKLEISTSNLRFYPKTGLVADYSIIQVYGLASNNEFDLMKPGDRELLWDSSKKEMTIEEIEKELGYSVKIVKEH